MVTLEIRGREYPAMFDMRNVAELQEHFGGDLNALPEKLGNVAEAAYILALMIREGVELDNEEHHRQNVPPPAAVIEKLLTFADLQGENGLPAKIAEAFAEFYGKNVSSREVQEMVIQTTSASGYQTGNPGILETADKSTLQS